MGLLRKRTLVPELDPTHLDDEVFELLAKASTSTLATQLYKRGIRQPFLVGLAPVGDGFEGFVGEAFTMRFIPAREDVDPLGDPYRTGNVLQWEAVERVGPRQVIVVDSRGDTSAASAGDMLITRAMNRGAAGFVTDGALRDGHAVAGLGFPAYARCITATTRPASFHVADLQVPIGCAGVAVYPGDVLVGDRDGIIVVPRALAAEIAGPAAEQEALEQYLHNRVRAGEPLWGVYPPDENTLNDYRAWQQEQHSREAEGVTA
jgi:regulator of RNase E activity RraA